MKDVRGVGSEHDTAKSKNLHREEHMRVSQTRADTQCAARDELGGIQLTAHSNLRDAHPQKAGREKYIQAHA